MISGKSIVMLVAAMVLGIVAVFLGWHESWVASGVFALAAEQALASA
jgi:hypothetical protein